MKFSITDQLNFRQLRSENYNYILSKESGFFARWGKNQSENPIWSPLGPEILDIEISSGYCSNNCQWCYKNNGHNKPIKNMTLDTFKHLMDKMFLVTPDQKNKFLNCHQIAFGICDIDTNPELVEILKYTRELAITPNITLTGSNLTEDLAKRISKLVGAVSISVHENQKENSYKTVKTFTDLGVKQTNIHLMFSGEKYNFVMKVLKDRLFSPELKDMNAIVFLTYKPKGRNAGKFNQPTTEQYQNVIKFCIENNISFGFDSCGAPLFEKIVNDMNLPDIDKETITMFCESCESTLFSGYINVDCEYYPCSFCEKEKNIEGINILKCDNFIKDVWLNNQTIKFRSNLLNKCKTTSCRTCPIFKLN